ncbi:uncharacterized protein LOC143373477 isoform X2 [Andrena cerasifolii]|uniref:uncharacterized protein LOC143373477 isoform X2 n=1 Tax=Andrena cerasifolii TaxID=2819439 RepID=UPI0040377322
MEDAIRIDKHRIATLQEIAKQLQPYQNAVGNPELTPLSAARYLVEAKENDNNNFRYHSDLGSLDDYLYENAKEQRKKILKFCKENLQNKALQFSMRAFVLEVGKSKDAHICIKKYRDEYKEFLEKQEHSLNQFYEALKSELSRPTHVEVFDSWIEYVEDEFIKRELKDYFLLSNRSNNQLQQDMWDKCCKDQDILTMYNDYILEKGLISGSYLELLACTFGINVRLYVEEQDNKLYLIDNRNLSSTRIEHVLLNRDNKFIQLSINGDYLRLDEERRKKNNIYTRVLVEIDSFKQKQEFDDYLEKRTFLSENEDMKFEQSFYNKYSSSEEEDIRKIVEYFPEGEKQLLKDRLGTITSQCIGQQGILHNVLKRFSSEGRHVSSQELYHLVNSILISNTEGKKEQNIFWWIIAAYPQRNWIDELILLQLENFFRKPLAEKSKWREYLSKIENKDILLLFNATLHRSKPDNFNSTQCIEDILHLLSNIPNETINLEGLELSEWFYALKEKYWTYKLSKVVDGQDLSTASYYVLSMENTFGPDLVEKLIEILIDKKQKLSRDILTNILSNFYNEKWNLSAEVLEAFDNCNVNEWAQKMQQKFTWDKERNITQLVQLIKSNYNTSKRISDNLLNIQESISSICNRKYAIAGKAVCSFTEADIDKWVKEFQHKKRNKGEQDIEVTPKEMLAVIDRAIELKRRFKLRDTQRLTVLALLTNDHSTLAQVSTGEGKSLIVVAASIMKALCGGVVHIVTSSSVLAKRDAEGNGDIYSLFHINVSHNCSEDIEKRKEAYSSNQVVYGDLSNFQRDYLLDKFYGKNIFGDHDFGNVIVDEVDSMLLDKGNNMLYLSHDLASLDKLESVYIYIWQWINRPATNYEELSYVFDIGAIREAVLSDLYDLVKAEDIGKLDSGLSEQQKHIIWERLFKAKILDAQGKLLRGSVDDISLNEMLSPEFISYKDRLGHLFKECIEREKCVHVPNHLKPFVEQHLESWINSAITAFFMKAGHDYVVDVDRTGSTSDRNPQIIILDKDTGTDQRNSQWDEVLHQFLQLKHGCKLSLQSLKAVFVSNVSFFKLYDNLYGLTGTLGFRTERDLLKQIHEVDFVTIPTAKSKQFHEDKPILCTSKEEWINRIRNEARKLTEEKKRSVLIICETLNDVDTLHKAFGGKNAKHVHTYTRDYEEFDIAQGIKELEQGQIIIATNLAGRGTDVKITEGLRQAEGLHVCLTYLPKNNRIEQQAFGRTARSGDKGSGQLIIMDTKGKEYSNSKVLDSKKERDVEELHRISGIKTYYETRITVEENCFKAFKKQYERLKKELDESEISTEVKEILLQSCLDKWAFWLDENSKHIKNLTDEQGKRNFNDLLNKFISQLKDLKLKYSKDWLAWVDGQPNQMIKLGKYLSQNKELDNAVELFDEVIKQEPYFSEAAHYYKAFALTKIIDWEQKPLNEKDKKILKRFKNELREAAKLLDERSKFAMNAAGIIREIKKNSNESIIQIDAYEEQQKNLINLYSMFSGSIDDIFGHFITPQSFVNSDIKEELATVLCEDLLREGILKKQRVKKDVSDEELKGTSFGYGIISTKMLKEFLSGYEEKEIDEKEFQQALKKATPLPSREAFWKSLIEQKVLNAEVKYAVVNNEKLKEVDASLSAFLAEEVNAKRLKTQTLESDNDQIFLHAERITQKGNNSNVYKKDDFIKAIRKYRYQVLKKRGILSFNRKAHIDNSKIGTVNFSCYDSITLEDFTKVNITKNEAEKILAELERQNIIEKKDKSNSAYGLKIEFDKIEQVELRFCPVYENAVKHLLSVCFAYRIALQRIVRQLKDKKSPVRLQLMTKPHQSLVWELLEQKIIRPITVTTEGENIEETLKRIYRRTMMTKDDIKLMLSQGESIPKDCTEKLFNCLIKEWWIVQWVPIPDGGISSVIGNANKSLDGLLSPLQLYYINEKIPKIPLNFSPEASCKNELTKMQNIDKMVEKVLDNRLQLSKESTIKYIVRTLEQSRSTLKSLTVPNGTLKPLTEFCSQGKFANIEEVHIFLLNGLDELLQLGEKKWTREMLFNTAIVVAMGITQIAVGAVIELYSVGCMTHVGAAFVNEGVNDIFYAAGALKSGYFNWNDYGQHKLQSLMSTAASVGIGAYLSKGTQVSRYGHKLAGPNFEAGGKKVAEMCGNQLIKEAGWMAGKAVVTRIILKTVEGIAFGFANATVDMLVENYLRTLCEGIASNILSDVEREVDRHNISTSLRKAYTILGEEEARKKMNDLTQSVFTDQNCVEKFLPVASKIASSVTQGITEAIKKRSKTSNKLEFPIHTISQVVVWTERVAHIATMINVTSNILDNLNKKINRELEKNAKRVKEQKAEEDYENFKKEISDEWKSLLRQKAGQIIELHILSPILKEGANRLVRYVGKKIQEGFQSYKEDKYSEEFDKLKQQYLDELRNAGEQQGSNMSETENHIIEQYHENLKKLMMKTGSPVLFAEIIKQNVPMDMTCVSACIPVIHTALEEQGIVIPGLTIIVEGEGGIRQEFRSGPEGAGGVIVKLELKDKHFQLCGSSTSGNNRNGGLRNNCLYEALSKAIPPLSDMTPKTFRDKVASCIEQSPEIKHHILQGWHKLPLSLGAYGGYRAPSKTVFDEESSEINDYAGNKKEYQFRTRGPIGHIVARFERYIRFGGMIQRISEDTGIDRSDVVKGGPSQYQDQHSNRGKEGIQAAHLIRVGEINANLTPSHFEELKNFIGHTQNVSKEWNYWQGVGGGIDRYQSSSLRQLAEIDFSGDWTNQNKRAIENIRSYFVAEVVNQMRAGRMSESNCRNIVTALSASNVENVFKNEGKGGYSGKYRDNYL